MLNGLACIVCTFVLSNNNSLVYHVDVEMREKVHHIDNIGGT